MSAEVRSQKGSMKKEEPFSFLPTSSDNLTSFSLTEATFLPPSGESQQPTFGFGSLGPFLQSSSIPSGDAFVFEAAAEFPTFATSATPKEAESKKEATEVKEKEQEKDKVEEKKEKEKEEEEEGEKKQPPEEAAAELKKETTE